MIQKPTPTNSVRVWTGFRRAGLAHRDFLAALGDTFVPGTLTVLKPLGIAGYIVCVLFEDDPNLPGESALIVYSSPDHYKAVTRDNLRGRVHRASHFAVFDMDRSRAVFPVSWQKGDSSADTYYLYDRDIDWQAARVVFTLFGTAGDPGAIVAESVKAALGKVKSTLDLSQCMQAIVVVRDVFAVVWSAFESRQPLDPKTLRDSLTTALPKSLVAKECLIAETLACYGEDAELMTIQKDVAIQFRFLRAPTSEMF